MAKRKRENSLSIINRKISEGRGFNKKNEYKPWLQIQDVPSIGTSSRTKGIKTGRIQHTLSELESNVLLILDWDDSVTDIREQFPLLKLEDTKRIADEFKIKHPKDPKSKEFIIMTTDFLITKKENGLVHDEAIAVKYSKDLTNKRVLEKLNIEKVYWQRRGIKWRTITEKDINKVLCLNLRNIHSFINLYEEEINKTDAKMLLYYLKQKLNEKGDDKTLNIICRNFDKLNNFDVGTGLMLMKYLLVNKYISLDLENKKLIFCNYNIADITFIKNFYGDD